jgi:hypothetical protein
MIELSVQYRKNEGLVLSPSELKELYFYGIQIRDKYGNEISDDTWRMYIESAQSEIEKFLSIKLFKQIFQEDLSFYRDEFESFGFIRTTYPVVQPYSLNGFIGTIKQIEYPIEWLSNRTTTDGYTYNRQIYIVPNYSNIKTGSIVYNGIVPYLGILGYQQVPNYWRCRYVTGYDKIPKDLLNIVGMLASLGPFGIAANLVLHPGVTGQSLGIDGLSQSINTGMSGDKHAFSSRVAQYIDAIKTSLSRLQTTYKGIQISSM